MMVFIGVTPVLCHNTEKNPPLGISTDYILIGCEIRNYEAAKELDSVINQLVALKMKL